MYSTFEKNRYMLIYLPLVIYWTVLFIATTLPGSSVPHVGVGDKFMHFLAYFILSLLLSLAFNFQHRFKEISSRPFFFAILIIFLYSVIDEIHQSFIPGRFCELADIAADMSGAIMGALLIKLLIKRPMVKEHV